MLTRTYYKGASGCLVMFDVTNRETLKGALTWKQDLDEKVMLPSGSSVPAVLLGNKVQEPHTSTSAQCSQLGHSKCMQWPGGGGLSCLSVLRPWMMLCPLFVSRATSPLFVTCDFCVD